MPTFISLTHFPLILCVNFPLFLFYCVFIFLFFFPLDIKFVSKHSKAVELTPSDHTLSATTHLSGPIWMP